ncbi:3-deoxy-D-manno-octulosonic acid transferase [Seohaeicola nanhaiensis]|uniref:3-deoxy-D-manno-octulosonic acid transferase n=1 Tax=Seohaeicola nanhaiensis TaxID=1387282 RepID=A0ABV9KFK9_9RHOB
MSAPLAGEPLSLRGYRWLTSAALPFFLRSTTAKLREAHVDEVRLGEKDGRASLPRPAAPLVWFHAASVGESLLVLTLLAKLAARLPGHEFLITSGTATSAEMLARRMPQRCRHQFAPLDAPGPVARFLDHWRPDAGIFVESELWPLLLTEAGRRAIPMALLNARLSAKSVKGWARFPAAAARVLSVFRLMIAQNDEAAQNLRALGADPARVSTGGNLKSFSPPPPVDSGTLAQLRDALGTRPVWAASSTHPGEEAVALAAHSTLLARWPDLCLILIPRHPSRGGEVARLIRESGLTVARRSLGEWPDTAQVFLADTLGETGTWYAAAPIVFLGGSLQPIGGHNPFEPAQAGAAVLTGPHVTNFTETFTPLVASGAAREVQDAASLAGAVAAWLDEPDKLAQARDAARRFAADSRASLDGLADRLCAALELAQ